jgi:hypothetical protein
VSPVEQEPVNFAPSLSTSSANWWRVSPLDRVIVTISPRVTVMVGLGTLELFQAETEPVRVIERLAAATLGIGVSGINARIAAVSKKAVKRKMQNLRFTMGKLLHR